MPLNAHETAVTRADPRADDRRREVAFGQGAVVIARRLAGISMRIRVPLASYQGVALRLAGGGEGRALHRVELLHRDPDLSIPLGESADPQEIAAEWTAWAESLALPRLFEGEPGRLEEIRMEGRVALPAPRRRGSAVARRRTRFSRRRRMGALERLATAYRGEREIIASE
jgi:Family of unknown function (DUF6101)